MKRIKQSIILIALLLLLPISIKAEELNSNGSFKLQDNLLNEVNVNMSDLYVLKNEILLLEENYKKTIVSYINNLDKDNVLTDITVLNNDNSYKDFITICSAIYTTQNIVDKGNKVYKTKYGDLTTDTNETEVIVNGATANNLSVGTRAWVDGHYIIGNGLDNKEYYDKGYADGIDYANSSYEVVYTYHAHGDGYCNQTPKYHTHSGSSSSGGGCYGIANTCYGKIKLSRSGCDIETYASKCYYVDHSNVAPCFNRRCPQHHCTETYKCSSCGATYSKEGTCTRTRSYSTNCGKTTSTIDSYYCSILEGTITSAKVEFY